MSMLDRFTVVDLFAGGGGASEGIRRALGVSPWIAVNHDEAAVQMHAANHPGTMHLCKSVFAVPPTIVGRRHVDLLWASPDCTHFSRAKGSTPRKKEIRDLAWVVIDWAETIRPAVICLENVAEFVTWGPLHTCGRPGCPDHPECLVTCGHPIKERSGETFREFVGRLHLLGYRVEWRILCAADYGAPTSRRRLFLVARRDQEAITWPGPTHGPGRPDPWRTAAECIDWDIPCLSIFERRKPLAEATQRRIAEGIRRYVLNGDPFVVVTGHQASDAGKVRGIDEPLSTIVTKAEHCLVAACLSKHYGGPNGHRCPGAPMGIPVATVTAKDHHSLVSAFLTRYHGERRSGEIPRVEPLDEALPTQTTENRFGLAAAYLINTRNGEREGQAPRALDIKKPIGTVTSQGSQGALVAAFLDKLHGSALAGQPIDQPAPTVTAGGGRGGGHAALVAAFLLKYYGTGSQWSAADEPMHTVVSKARMGLVTMAIEGEEYALVDIGMRMLQPRELARAQGFQDEYVLTGTKAEQVARIGNSVPPDVVAAIVRANVGPEAARRAA